jgi:uncharacterized membrane protein YphA (DoxX/SURF4 family)
MNIALWIIQALLAFVFLAAGAMKLVKSKTELEQQQGMGYVTERSAQEMKLIGLAEVLGGIGLIVPWLLNILPILTPIAAAGLTMIMLGAIVTHVRRKESALFVTGLTLLTLIVAIARFRMMA